VRHTFDHVDVSYLIIGTPRQYKYGSIYLRAGRDIEYMCVVVAQLPLTAQFKELFCSRSDIFPRFILRYQGIRYRDGVVESAQTG
jgi:hypothetical protein